MKKIILKVILIASILFYISSAQLLAQGSKLKIIQVGCLDLRKVIEFVSSSISAQSKLVGADNEVQDKINEIEKKISLLEQEKKNLEDGEENSLRQRNIAEQIEFEKKNLSDLLKSELGENSPDLESRQLSQQMIRSIYRAINEVAERNGYSIILDKNQAVIYSSDDVDITDLVIKQITK